MKITVMALFISICSFFQVFRTIFKVRRETIGLRSAIIWMLIWIGIGVCSLFPVIIDYFVRLVQMESRILFVLLLAELIIFALIFNLASRLDKVQKNISLVVQELGILRYHSSIDVNQQFDKERLKK